MVNIAASTPIGQGRGPGSLISVGDLSPSELKTLVSRSHELFTDRHRHDSPLAGKVVGTLFTATSTRTRTAFTVAAIRLGACVISYGAGELQTCTGETFGDTARVLGGMVDGIVIRDAVDAADLRGFARLAGIPVVNAMAREEHPTQGISDLAMLVTRFGALDGIHLVYLGEGNNTASALAFSLALTPGTSLTLATPSGYGLDPSILHRAQELAAVTGSRVTEVHDPDAIIGLVDVVYTTQWCTTGTVKLDPKWRDSFLPFKVDERLMARWPTAVFMHDLPAHRGEEVAAGVLDGARSIAWDQAHMKLASAMAVLEWCLGSA